MGFTVVGSLAAVVGGILIIVGIVLYCGTGGAYLPFTDYAIAIDVRPTESTVSLYKWNEDKKVVEEGNCVAGNGIDYKIEKNGAFNHLLYCVQELASQRKSEHKIPVLVDASSGLKLLEDRNKTAAQSLLTDINDSLKKLKVNNSLLTFGKPKIVSGEHQTLDAWIAANYLVETSEAKMNGTDNTDDTVGILDMGGASANIAFEVDGQASNSEANILGKQYYLKTSSNLCYGIHQALNRYYTLLIKDFQRAQPHNGPEFPNKPQPSEKPMPPTTAAPKTPFRPKKVAPFAPPNESQKAKLPANAPWQSGTTANPKEAEEKEKQDTLMKKEEAEEQEKMVDEAKKEEEKKKEEEMKRTPQLTPEDKALENTIEKMEGKNAGTANANENRNMFKREIKESDRPDVLVEDVLIPDPCSNDGIERQIKGSELLNEICVNNADGKPPTEHISANLEYKFFGSNDPVKCRQYITRLTSSSECRQNFDKCASNNITVPSGATFVAFSNYYKISRAIPELRVSPSISLEKYDSATKAFCSYPWNFVAKSTAHLCEADEEVCKNYCFGLQLIERTLSDLYNFGVHDWNNVLFVNKIHNTHLNWILGDVLLASNKIPGGKPTPPVLPMYGLILMLVAGVVLLGYGLANMYTVHSKRSNYESV